MKDNRYRHHHGRSLRDSLALRFQKGPGLPLDKLHPRRRFGILVNQSFQVAHGVTNTLPSLLGRWLGGFLSKRWDCQHCGGQHKRGDSLDGLHSGVDSSVALI